ncbi:MAG: hypothetical protein AAGF07_03440 [Patescibacteria group bacterium]
MNISIKQLKAERKKSFEKFVLKFPKADFFDEDSFFISRLEKENYIQYPQPIIFYRLQEEDLYKDNCKDFQKQSWYSANSNGYRSVWVVIGDDIIYCDKKNISDYINENNILYKDIVAVITCYQSIFTNAKGANFRRELRVFEPM